MKGIKSFLSGAFLISAVCICSYYMAQRVMFLRHNSHEENTGVTNTSYGDFLAAQHALYVNDFDSALDMLNRVDSDSESVKTAKILVDFLNGKMPKSVDELKSAKDIPSRMIYDAHLVNKDDWKSVLKRHTKDDSALFAPIRIFAMANQGQTKESIKYVNSLKTSNMWKSFVRGQIYALKGDIDKAAKEFADVHPDFMNINDYLYLMSFYRENKMFEDMEILKTDFVSKPGGMYVLDYEEIPQWSEFSGYKNNLVFSMIQMVSHTQIMMYTDLSLMMLRFSQIISNESNADALNYYMGLYYFFNNGDYEKQFAKISPSHPLYLFGKMKIAEKNGDLSELRQIVRKNPLFVPAVKILIANYIKNGEKNRALHIVNRALKHKNMTDISRVYFLKQRANIYLLFNQPKKAQKDLKTIFDIDDRLTSDMLLLQARAWYQTNRNLNDAYDYVMMLIKRNTSDVEAWDILGQIVEKQEGTTAALEVLERVGEISVDTSSLYEHLGDMYKKQGNKEKAINAYKRALELSDDGLVIAPIIKRKLRKL